MEEQSEYEYARERAADKIMHEEEREDRYRRAQEIVQAHIRAGYDTAPSMLTAKRCVEALRKEGLL